MGLAFLTPLFFVGALARAIPILIEPMPVELPVNHIHFHSDEGCVDLMLVRCGENIRI